MSKERKIAYEPHPVTAERKKELNDQGYKIIDARFKPQAATFEKQDGPPTREQLDFILSELPGDNDNPDYVVGRLSDYFGDLFTEDDELYVRELVKAPAKKPSHGLRIDDIKAKLAEKSIEFKPDAERAELAKLLDESAE